MARLTERQVAVMRKSRELSSYACTTALSPAGISVAQVGAVCRQLERKGYMQRQATYERAWSITPSGNQWLRSLDAGRPWMVKKSATPSDKEGGESVAERAENFAIKHGGHS